MQIGSDRSAMYVTFNSTWRLKESMTILPWSEKIVEGVLKDHVCDGTNVMISGNTVNQFMTLIVGGWTVIHTSPKPSLFPVLLRNTKVTLPENIVIGYVMTINQDVIIPLSTHFHQSVIPFITKQTTYKSFGKASTT